MDRRSYLVTGLATCLGGVAGCAGNGDGPSEGGTATDTDTDTPTATDTDTPTATDTDTPTATDEAGESIRYGVLHTHDSDYKADIDYTDPDSDKSWTAAARYHGDDHYVRVMPDDSDDVYEQYVVDDTTYLVVNEENCFIDPPSGSGAESASEAESNSDAEVQGNRPDADLRPDGTDEIDGETVYVFKVTGEDVEGTLTLYVSAETGYLRRVKGNWGTADFYSWGDTEPISKPDMECIGY
jgi:hypothetical protein